MSIRFRELSASILKADEGLHGLFFNVHGSVHRRYFRFDIFPTRYNITQFIYFWTTALHVSGGISTHYCTTATGCLPNCSWQIYHHHHHHHIFVLKDWAIKDSGVNDTRIPARSHADRNVSTSQLVTIQLPNKLLCMRLPRVAPRRVLNRRRSRRNHNSEGNK